MFRVRSICAKYLKTGLVCLGLASLPAPAKDERLLDCCLFNYQTLLRRQNSPSFVETQGLKDDLFARPSRFAPSRLARTGRIIPSAARRAGARTRARARRPPKSSPAGCFTTWAAIAISNRSSALPSFKDFSRTLARVGKISRPFSCADREACRSFARLIVIFSGPLPPIRIPVSIMGFDPHNWRQDALVREALGE